MLNSHYQREAFKIAGQDFSQYSKQEIREMLEDADLTEYDVIITESSFSPSTRLEIARTIFELITQGAQIPPELAFEFLDVPSELKSKITDSLQQQQQAQTQSQADTNNSEVTKTLLAKGEYTVSPEKAQELGLIPTNQNAPLANDLGSADNGMDQSTSEYANNLASSIAG
jgi:hypothetical protein